ncbi:efflux RND transporter periplasmic adaptor subunit [Agrilutibacter solisilvae]|uniref:Efflux RND transporter periplasmic adaptor subunit n=1 Tax=Agrilutibacter solisilvae TaxID=2763317 RepID=A0A975ASN8_9GAMM|nr:efflux RND transporter periplasmic adaptor subunit [Lysobacter solisilvae]QSX78473.1 efflux RND transporter periplasmic adaptor subunit [Lysobacter solisilvae]
MTARSPTAPPRRSVWSRRLLVVGLVALVLAVAAFALRRGNGGGDASGYRTATVDRGDIRVVISATGTLAAISTVEVGSQISGQVTDVLVDFNDHVARGQVIARIDPSTYQAQIAQGDAAVNSARAALATAQAALRNADADHARKAELVRSQLISRSDVDLARAALDQARAQVSAAQAQIHQQIASTRSSRLNMERTVIRSPVEGVVLTRAVEPGQTVAATMTAPVLFQIAENLSQMEIVLAIDEADIGKVRTGQAVGFSVDAYPERQYRGKVQQLRLAATNTNNVITYPVVVAVDNADQSLLPGMTANAEIEVSQRRDVLRISNAALRFKPAEEAQGSGGAGGQGARGGGLASELPHIAAGLRLDARQQAAFDAALEQVRQRSQARERDSQGEAAGGSLFGGARGIPGGGNRRSAGEANSGAMRQRMAERFNQQFAAFRATLAPAQQARWDADLAALLGARRAPVYKLVDGEPKAVTVRVGASDGTHTEIAGDVAEGDALVTGSERGKE